MELTREITLPATAEEVWRSLAEPEWLGEDAAIDLHPGGDVRAGERTGFVEEAEQPSRLVFWWSAPGQDATRVEIELEPDAERTHLRVAESRPFAVLDLYGAEILHSFPAPQSPGSTQPEMLVRG